MPVDPAAWIALFQREPWRPALKVGDEVDACNFAKSWFDAVVVDTTEDKVKVHFRGWTSKWDEWFARTSDLVQPLLSRTEDWRDLKPGDLVEVRGPPEFERQFGDGKALWFEGAVTSSLNGWVMVDVLGNSRIKPRWVSMQSESICRLGAHTKSSGASSRGAPPSLPFASASASTPAAGGPSQVALLGGLATPPASAGPSLLFGGGAATQPSAAAQRPLTFGAHIDRVLADLRGKGYVDDSEVRGAIATLAAEGQIYSTFDEHYRSTLDG